MCLYFSKVALSFICSSTSFIIYCMFVFVNPYFLTLTIIISFITFLNFFCNYLFHLYYLYISFLTAIMVLKGGVFMNISETEINSSCSKAIRLLSISYEMNSFVNYVAKGQTANAETELKKILEKAIAKCIYQSLNDLD